jgi:hypothetical protein
MANPKENDMVHHIARRLRREERGIAMVVAVMTLMVVVLVSVTVVSLSSHNAGQSASDRNRLQAIAAAEAGLDDWLASMPNTQAPAVCQPLSQNLPTDPSSHYDVTIKVYGAWPPADGSELACVDGIAPLGALVQSKGTAVTGGSHQVARTMEMLVRLGPSYGSLNMALFSDTGINIAQQFTDNGYSSNDADIYTNGNFFMNNNSTIHGSIFAQGTADLSNGGAVYEDVWAKGDVTIGGNTAIYGNVKSSTGTVTVNSPARVYGDVRASGSISGSGTIDGNRISNSPITAPPALTFPHYNWVPPDWQAASYTINTYTSCTDAMNFINAMPAGNYVVRITSVCPLTWANNAIVTVRGNLAIVTEGSVSFTNQVTWIASGGQFNVHFVRPWASGLNCASGSYDIRFTNNTSWNGITLGAYSPCTIDISNLQAEKGQIFAGTIVEANNQTFTYAPILFPGSKVTGYDAQVSYIREIVNP